MYLYFNGDSFMAGFELGHHIMPTYPGLSHTPNRAWLDNCRPTTIQKNEIRKLEYERSLPYKVATKLNLPFSNNARAGASMDRIARTTITDLLKLKKTNRNIVAFIGTTDMSRSEIAVNADQSQNEDNWHSIIPSHKSYKETEEIELVRKYKISNETNYHNFINFYKNIILVQDFCKLNDIQLYWVEAEQDHTTDRNIQNVQNDDYLDLKNYANLSYHFGFKRCYETHFKDQKVICPGGHYGEIIHERLSEEIVSFIKTLR